APIAQRSENFLTNLDWAKECELPVVVVARRGLGTINHTLLTLGVLRAHSVAIRGLIFCDAEPVAKNHVAAQTSPALIAEICGLPILANVPFVEDLSRANLQQVARDCFGETPRD